jgi:predicted ribosome quality control (RQC) complex YloA/Tae2 family protein
VLSLSELRRAARLLDARYAGHRLERCVQPDGGQVALSLYGREPSEIGGESEGAKRFLLLSARPGLARVSQIESLPKAPDRPPAFVSYLRAHLPRAVLRGARIVDDDRQLALRFEAREGPFDLLLAIFGRRSIVYVLDEAGTLVAALRPLEETRPELALGAPYRSPAPGRTTAPRDRWEEASDSDYLRLVEAHYCEQESESDSQELGRRLAQALRKEAKSSARRLERVEAELAEADLAGEYARHGELLKSVLGRIRQGDTEVRVADYETGEEVVIPLDPTKSPKANLEATFKRYQKLLRRLTKAGGRVDPARAWLEQIRALLTRVEALLEAGGESTAAKPESAAAESESAAGESESAAGEPENATASQEKGAELEEIAARPEIAKLLASKLPAAKQPAAREQKSSLPARLRDVPGRMLPRRYRSRDGMEIWVGRSDEANDYLTTRLARGKDLFFHVESTPGSHVILRTEGRPDPPPESVIDACELAVHYSKSKKAGSANVHVVPIKQVKKPKGAKRGLVYVTGGKTIHLRREPKRIERLLDSRIED